MGTIVAIGGGEIGRPGYPLETLKIDERIVGYCGKDAPRLCFIPTATNDSEIYIAAIEKLYGYTLKCDVQTILLTKSHYTKKQLSDIVLDSDIVYVGGGNTALMLDYWNESGLSDILMDDCAQGRILCGLSVGAICWFEHGASDSLMGDDIENGRALLECLGLIPGILCPHYQKDDREERFMSILRERSDIGFGIDDCAALAIVDDGFEVICSKEEAYVHKVYWQDGEMRTAEYANGYQGSVEELTRK